MNKVAVFIEDLVSQFRTLGEGQQVINERITHLETNMNTRFAMVDNRITAMRLEIAGIKDELANFKAENAQEHQEIRQMIRGLSTDQKIVQEKLTNLDQEFENKIRRVK